MFDDIKHRFPNLGELSVAIIEHMIDSIIGPDAIKIIKKPYEAGKLEDTQADALIKAESRWLNSLEDLTIDDRQLDIDQLAKIFHDLPIANLPSLKEAIVTFYQRPSDPLFSKTLFSSIRQTLPQRITNNQVEKIVDSFIQRLRLELFDTLPEFRTTLDAQIGFEQRDLLKTILERMDHFTDYVCISPDVEKYLREIYLNRIEKATKKMPWGYAISAISPDIDISQVYVLPTFTPQDKLRPSPIILDEKRELEQEHRDQENTLRTVARPAKIGLYEILGMRNPVAVLGYMGTGKSFTANYIAWLFTKKNEQNHTALTGTKLPIIIKLGDRSVVSQNDLNNSLFDLAVTQFQKPDRMRLAQILRKEWEAGKVILILDALDEFSGHPEWIRLQIEYIAENLPDGSQLIITSRPSAYRMINPRGFTALEIDDIDENNLGRFVGKWVNALHPTSDKSAIHPDEHTAFLVNQILRHPRVQSIVVNPQLLTILVVLSLSKYGINLEEIKNETELYNEYVSYLIRREKEKNQEKYGILSEEYLRIIFGYTGYIIQVNSDKKTPTLYDEVRSAISASQYFKKEPNGSWLVENALNFWIKTGLIIEYENLKREITFRHLAFQYFAAALGLMFLSPEMRAEQRKKIDNDPLWHEVLTLFLGINRPVQLD